MACWSGMRLLLLCQCWNLSGIPLGYLVAALYDGVPVVLDLSDQLSRARQQFIKVRPTQSPGSGLTPQQPSQSEPALFCCPGTVESMLSLSGVLQLVRDMASPPALMTSAL